MSLFGKILVVLNLLGAAGLVYFAAADYARRQAWAHSVTRHEVMLAGLPVDDKELDAAYQVAVDRLGDDDYTDMFKTAGGRPVKTQAEEFDAVKKKVNDRLDGAEQNKVLQTYLLARVLLPLVDTYLEREQVLAARAHFENVDKYNVLKERCRKALTMLPGRVALPGKSFKEAFRAAFHLQGGEPAEFFVSLLLRNYPDDRQKALAMNFDGEFDAAVEAQRTGLRQTLNAMLAEASGQAPNPNDPKKAPDAGTRKSAIARMLFGLAQFQAEEAIFSDSGNANDRQLLTNVPTFAEFQKRLVFTETFKQLVGRMLVVCGLRSSLTAIGDRTVVVRRLTDYLQGSAAGERQQFVNDHNFILETIREQAKLVKAEQAVINENKERQLGFASIVKQRQAEINTLKEEHDEMKKYTAREMGKLRELSRELLEYRLKIRDAIETTEKGEERIRLLEKQVRDLDRRKGE